MQEVAKMNPIGLNVNEDNYFIKGELMLTIEQCEFLLNDNIIKITSKFLQEKGLTNVRICSPQSEQQRGKIVLLLNNTNDLDDFKICQLLGDLHSLKEFKKNPHRKDFVFQIEEGTQPFFKKRMQESAISFTEESIKNFAAKLDDKFGLQVKEEESAEDGILIISLQIRVKRARVDDKQALMKAVVENTKAAVEPHIVSNNRKKTLPQA